MAEIEGVNGVTKRRADGTVEYRYYAWRGRGAPCFWVSPNKRVKKPYPRAFIDAYTAAVSRKPAHADTFDGMAASYLESLKQASNPETTKGEYRRLVERARVEFSDTPLTVIADPRFRGAIIDYRDSLKATPRAADLAVLGVSLVLEHARNRGLLATNPAAGIPNLYAAPADKRPWTDDQIKAFTEGADQQVLDAFWLIRHFALRRRDAVAMTWAADRDTHLTFGTSKGMRKRRVAVVPILDEGRAFLDDLRIRNTALLARKSEDYAKKGANIAPLQTSKAFMLLTSRGLKWTAERSITQAFLRRWVDLVGETEAEAMPTPHRLRNNAATALMTAGVDDRTIADAMGWSKEDVEEMRRVYVDREAVISATVIQLRKARSDAEK